METNESRIRYLEAIQRVIDRLSNTSFILKGWAVSLVAGLMALAANDTNHGYVLVAYIPTVVFWLLDAYFLMMERQYRKLFEENMDFRNGVNDAFCEIVKAGVKKLALSHATDDEDVMLITESGTIIRLQVKDISVLGRATQGVTLMRTNDGGKVVNIETIYEEPEALEEADDDQLQAAIKALKEEIGE